MNRFLQKLAAKPLPWLNSSNTRSGIAISTRVRLARNIIGCQFPGTMNIDSKADIIDDVFEAVERLPVSNKTHQFELEILTDYEKKLLLERKLLAYEAIAAKECGIILEENERFSIVINEDDHLHIQAIQSGLSLNACWTEVEKMDNDLNGVLRYSFSDDFGYLTASPTNVGTGMKASVYLDLTGSLLTGQLPGIKRACQVLGHTFLGENSHDDNYCGTRFLISTRKTLGLTEKAVLLELNHFIDEVIQSEIKARRKLIADHPEKILDHISRAYGHLKYSYLLSEDEAIELLYTLKTGAELSFFDNINVAKVNRLLAVCGDAHLQATLQEKLNLEGLAIARALFLKSSFN